MSRDATPLDVIEGRAQWCVVTGDCRDVLALLPAGCVDAVVTDPPYLTTNLGFDAAGLDPRWIEDAIRAVQPNGYLASFGPVGMLADIGKVWRERWTGAWVKPQGVSRTWAAKKPRGQCELYAVFARPGHAVGGLTFNPVYVPGGEAWKKIQRNRGYRRGGRDQLDRQGTRGWTVDKFVQTSSGERLQTDVLSGPQKPCMFVDERTAHPTQKPVEAILPLVQWLTNPGDLILDPYAGSGTTGVAALRSGRRVILIEKDPAWIPDIVRRCADAAAQPRLFDDVPAGPAARQLAMDAG